MSKNSVHISKEDLKHYFSALSAMMGADDSIVTEEKEMLEQLLAKLEVPDSERSELIDLIGTSASLDAAAKLSDKDLAYPLYMDAYRVAMADEEFADSEKEALTELKSILGLSDDDATALEAIAAGEEESCISPSLDAMREKLKDIRFQDTAEPVETEIDSPSKLLATLENLAMDPAGVKKMVTQYRDQCRKENPSIDERKMQELIAKKLVSRFSKMTGLAGAVTGLIGVLPGVGTAVAVLGGTAADLVVCMKLQVDLCMCIAQTFNYNMSDADARHLAFLVALGGAVEKGSTKAAVDFVTKVMSKGTEESIKQGIKFASKAGVNALKSAAGRSFATVAKPLAVQAGKAAGNKFFAKALPFGVGVVMGGGINYGFTRYIGAQATKWFIIDRDES